MVPSVWGQVRYPTRPVATIHGRRVGIFRRPDELLTGSSRWTSVRIRMLLSSQVAAVLSCNGFMTFNVLTCSIGSTRSATFASFFSLDIFQYSPRLR